MSYAQPSPPTIQTLRRTSSPASPSSSRASPDPSIPARRRRSSATRSRRAATPAPPRSAAELGPRLARGGALGLAVLLGVGDGPAEVLPHRRGQALQELAGPGRLPVGGQPDAQAELRVVLEQGVGPGRPTPFGVDRPG